MPSAEMVHCVANKTRILISLITNEFLFHGCVNVYYDLRFLLFFVNKIVTGI